MLQSCPILGHVHKGGSLILPSKIIVALDNVSHEKAFELAQLLSPHVWGFKVNDALVDRGAMIISELKAMGTRVFSDPKVHDIPATHHNTVSKHASAGADLITVHASAGLAALQASVEAAQEYGNGNCKILCMMIPSSLDEQSCRHIYRSSIQATMYRLACMGLKAGINGFICAPPDLKFMTSNLEFADSEFVTPGIRLETSPADDQKRKATPAEAIAWGSNLLVIGRPITLAQDPLEVVQKINHQVVFELEKKGK